MKKLIIILGLFLSVNAFSQIGVGVAVGIGKNMPRIAVEVEGAITTKAGVFILTKDNNFIKTKSALVGYIDKPTDRLMTNTNNYEKTTDNFICDRKRKRLLAIRED